MYITPAHSSAVWDEEGEEYGGGGVAGIRCRELVSGIHQMYCTVLYSSLLYSTLHSGLDGYFYIICEEEKKLRNK